MPTLTLAQAIQFGRQHHQAGELAQAEKIYRQVLQADSTNAEVLYLLGMIAGQTGEYEIAIGFLQSAIQSNSTVSLFYYHLGNALMAQQRVAEAIENFRHTLRLNPTHSESLNNLGIALKQSGQLEEAATCLQQLLVTHPAAAQAHYNLGNVFTAQGKLNEAVSCYQQALQLHPQDFDTLNNLAEVLKQQGQWQAALTYYQQALALKPEAPEIHLNLGTLFEAQEQWQEAEEHFQQLVNLTPNHIDAHYKLNLMLYRQGKLLEAVYHGQQALQLFPQATAIYKSLGIIRYELGHYSEAVQCYQQALTFEPQAADLHNNLGGGLTKQGKLTEALACFQQALTLKPDDVGIYNGLAMVYKNLGNVTQSIAYYKTALQMNPEAWMYSNLLLGLNYLPEYDVATIFAEHQQFNEQYAKPLTPPVSRPIPAQPRSSPRLKLGYVSADFYAHAVSSVLDPILAHHDHQQFEIFCYYNSLNTDEVTVRLQRYADHWCNCASWSDEKLAKQIQQDQIDILVDLSGHTAGNRLLVFARKPAPVQVTYLGYPNTTGLTSIDYRITDNYMDPVGQTESINSETLLRMTGSYFCYCPHQDSPLVNPLPALEKGYITFGCLNGYYKLNSILFGWWAEILQAVPHSKLFVKNNSFHDQPTCQNFIDQFATLGIDSTRLMLEPANAPPSHLMAYHHIDLALDSYPFTGGITTFEALWMGIPVVTLVGDRHVSRQGLSILSTLGLPELVTYTPEEYVNTCVRLANDLEYLQTLRQELRERLRHSRLMDWVNCTHELEEIYRGLIRV